MQDNPHFAPVSRPDLINNSLDSATKTPSEPSQSPRKDDDFKSVVNNQQRRRTFSEFSHIDTDKILPDFLNSGKRILRSCRTLFMSSIGDSTSDQPDDADTIHQDLERDSLYDQELLLRP